MWGVAVPLTRIFFRFWILNRRILVQTECLLYYLPKAGLIILRSWERNAVPTIKITLGTLFSGIPAGNDPCV